MLGDSITSLLKSPSATSIEFLFALYALGVGAATNLTFVFKTLFIFSF